MADKKLIILPDFMIALRLMCNGRKTLSDIKVISNITYAHLHAMKKLFLKLQWVREEVEGRKHFILLTDKGHSIADGIEYLMQEMEISDNELLMYKRRKQAHKTPGMTDNENKK